MLSAKLRKQFENASIKLLLGMTIGIFGPVSIANAQVLVSGVGYGGPTQTNAHCYLWNAGPRTVTYRNFRIMNFRGQALPPTANTCNGLILPGSVCEFAANVVARTAYICSAEIPTDIGLVRGLLDIRVNDTPLAHFDMR